MAQVDREPVVPVLGRHLIESVALVVGRVVDQDPDRPEPPARLGDRLTERADVPEVTRQEQRSLSTGRTDPLLKTLGGGAVDVEERDLRAWGTDVLRDGPTYATRAAGHEHDALSQAGIRRVHHRVP